MTSGPQPNGQTFPTMTPKNARGPRGLCRPNSPVQCAHRTINEGRNTLKLFTYKTKRELRPKAIKKKKNENRKQKERKEGRKAQ